MRKKNLLKIMELQAEQFERHLREVRGIYREMRGYKHDFHNHLQTLRGQIETGEYSRALAYIDTLEAKLQEIDTLLKTGNALTDVILSGKLAQAKHAGIRVTVKANIPDTLAITDVELSIVFGNLLDNAIEACGRASGEKFIRIYIGVKGKMLYFSMLNSAGEKQKKQDSFFLTKKRGLHGFGLIRTEKIISRYGGWIKFNSEDGAFTTEFLVPVIEPLTPQERERDDSIRKTDGKRKG